MTNAQQLRKHMIEAVKPHLDKPIAFSGGVDSASILAAMLANDVKPELFTFMIPGVHSEDYEATRRIVKQYALTLHTVELPADKTQIVSDAIEVMQLIDTMKFPRSKAKVYVQCASPFLHLGKAAAANNVTTMLFAMAAGDLYATSRNYSKTVSKYGEEYTREKRREAICESTIESDFMCQAAARKYGLETIDIYKTPCVRDFLLSLDLAEMNKPKPKQIAKDAFPEFFDTFYRVPSSLQIAGGLRDYYAGVLIPEMNVDDANRRMAKLYRQLDTASDTLFETGQS